MIRLEDISTEEFNSVYIDINKGSLCKIIANSDHEKNILRDTILGIKKPLKGRAFLFGKDIYSTSEKEYYEIFKKVGMVWRDGGLISNLKVWENIILPLKYHTGKIAQKIEKRIIELFSEIGMDTTNLTEYMGKLPGPLPRHEKMFINILRAMLMEPDLIIYDSIFAGLNPEMIERLTTLTMRFHTEKSERTSIHISSEDESLKYIKADIIFRQKGRGFSHGDTERDR